MKDKILFEFAHIHKSDLYVNPETAKGVLVHLDRLAAVYELALSKIKKIQSTRDLTAQGKMSAFKELSIEIGKELVAMGNVTESYGLRVARVTEEMKPKPHDRNDLTWHGELREVREHIRRLDSVEREMFVLGAIERGDERIMEAIMFAPVPFTFTTKDVIDKMTEARSKAQYPEQAIALLDLQQAEREVRSALGSVTRNLARQGLNTSAERLTEAAAA